MTHAKQLRVAKTNHKSDSSFSYLLPKPSIGVFRSRRNLGFPIYKLVVKRSRGVHRSRNIDERWHMDHLLVVIHVHRLDFCEHDSMGGLCIFPVVHVLLAPHPPPASHLLAREGP